MVNEELDALKGCLEKWEKWDYDTLLETAKNDDDWVPEGFTCYWQSKLWSTCKLCFFYSRDCSECVAYKEGMCHDSLERGGVMSSMYHSWVSEDKEEYNRCHQKLVKWLKEKIEEVE